MIVLYGPGNAPFTEKVVRGLALKKLPFELREPTRPEDYRRWNPETGLLPLIDFDGERVHDSTQILLRLEELYPDPPLLSRDARTRAAQQNLEHWVDESFFFYWLRWQRLQSEVPTSEPSSPAQPPRRGLLGFLRSGSHPPAASPHPEGERLRDEVGGRLADLDRLLADRPFFYSNRISMADLGVYAMLKSLSRDGIPGTAAQLFGLPRLVEFMKRVEQATGS